MKVISKSFGDYGTNCYVVKTACGEIIIDPGDGAAQWALKNAQKPLAILLTHGHFDHIFGAARLRAECGAPIYIHENDVFMAQNDIFGMGYETFMPDFAVKDDEILDLGGISAKFMLFAGHTPGCLMIEIAGALFSGDFLFKGGVGRWDFPYSDSGEMIKSLQKCKNLSGDFTLYPGHGAPSTLKAEQETLDEWIRAVKIRS